MNPDLAAGEIDEARVRELVDERLRDVMPLAVKLVAAMAAQLPLRQG